MVRPFTLLLPNYRGCLEVAAQFRRRQLATDKMMAGLRYITLMDRSCIIFVTRGPGSTPEQVILAHA